MTHSVDASPAESSEIRVETFPVGPLQCNCTLLADMTTRTAIVVDPGGDADKILEKTRDWGVQITQLLHTHAHFDHILAAGALHETTQAALRLHPDDAFLWEHLKEQCAMFGLPAAQALPPPTEWLNHEEPIALGNACATTLHTPGHTPGSVCFHVPQARLLLAGDTLFRGSVGRTDLWGGDAATLERSIRECLYTLDDETTVIPGHGPATAIGYEMRNNMAVRAMNAKA